MRICYIWFMTSNQYWRALFPLQNFIVNWELIYHPEEVWVSRYWWQILGWSHTMSILCMIVSWSAYQLVLSYWTIKEQDQKKESLVYVEFDTSLSPDRVRQSFHSGIILASALVLSAWCSFLPSSPAPGLCPDPERGGRCQSRDRRCTDLHAFNHLLH